MAAKKQTPPKSNTSQSARFLEAARKAKVGSSERKFADAMGKKTMASNARKATKMG